MVEYRVTEPTNIIELEEIVHIREISAIKAYSSPNGPSEQDVRIHYSSESSTIISNIRNKEYNARMIRVEEVAVAMCVWSFLNEKARIEYLYTHPEYQRSGFGSVLLDSVLDELENVEVELTTQNAQVFYEKWGFVRTGRYITDEITSEEIMLRKK